MTAFNVVGESPSSAPVEVFVGEAGMCLCLIRINPVTQFSNLNHKLAR